MNTFHEAQSFHPGIASTPGPGMAAHHYAPPSPPQMYYQQQQQAAAAAAAAAQQQVTFSGKHNGLYLYFSRLVRPVWLKTLVAPTATAAGAGAPQQLESSVACEEVDWINAKLMELKSFIEKNAQVVAAAVPPQNQTVADASQVISNLSRLLMYHILSEQIYHFLGCWYIGVLFFSAFFGQQL